MYKEVLGEEGHAGEACKINRTYFAKGCFSCVGGSRLEVLKQNITSLSRKRSVKAQIVRFSHSHYHH